jgi:hypothetical protein
MIMNGDGLARLRLQQGLVMSLTQLGYDYSVTTNITW